MTEGPTPTLFLPSVYIIRQDWHTSQHTRRQPTYCLDGLVARLGAGQQQLPSPGTDRRLVGRGEFVGQPPREHAHGERGYGTQRLRLFHRSELLDAPGDPHQPLELGAGRRGVGNAEDEVIAAIELGEEIVEERLELAVVHRFFE